MTGEPLTALQVARAVAGFILCLAPAIGAAAWQDPFHTRDLSPLALPFGIPPAESASTVAAGKVRWRFDASAASQCTQAIEGPERVTLDGETYVVGLGVRYGLFPWLELGVDVPYVSHEDGILDTFIESFHDAFGMPQGARPHRPRDDLLYQYGRDGHVLLWLEDRASGLGDVRIQLATPIAGSSGTPRSAALRGSVKLPTGDADGLLGSGAVDLALVLSGRDAATLAPARLSAEGSAGVLLPGRGDVLADRLVGVVGFGHAGVRWDMTARVAPMVQVDWHSPLYRDSDLEQLGSWSLQMAVGGRIGLTRSVAVDIAVCEDIAVRTVPDVTFHVAVRGEL